MTDKQCFDHVWSKLQPRKHILGRRAVARMVDIALDKASSGSASADAAAAVFSDARERQAAMGIVLTVFLSAFVNQIVTLVFEWLKQRNRDEQR